MLKKILIQIFLIVIIILILILFYFKYIEKNNQNNNADKIKDSSLVNENYIVLDDKRIAFNLNTKEDYELLSSS